MSSNSSGLKMVLFPTTAKKSEPSCHTNNNLQTQRYHIGVGRKLAVLRNTGRQPGKPLVLGLQGAPVCTCELL